MSESKVKVVDAGGVEREVRPVDAAEIVAAGGSYDLEAMKAETKTKNTQIIEGVTTGRADSVPHTPVSPDSARESIDYDEAEGKGGKSSVYPEHFPGRAVLQSAGVGYHKALRMSEEDLIAVSGIGAKTAKDIIKFRQK